MGSMDEWRLASVKKRSARRVRFTPFDDRYYESLSSFADHEPRIFKMVLVRAYIDIVSGEEPVKAAAWIRNDKDFATVCNLAGYDEMYVKKIIINKLESL